MAERAYARLSRILDHQFREKKPIMLFASRTDFGQNNVTGDLGEGTAGVTEAQRHRMLLNFTGDYAASSTCSRTRWCTRSSTTSSRAARRATGCRRSRSIMPPLWFAEGMAEYLSLGPSVAEHDDVDARRRAVRQASRRSSS